MKMQSPNEQENGERDAKKKQATQNEHFGREHIG
jgi:hypothetical protein